MSKVEGKAKIGRPKSLDPTIQLAIYPRQSLWKRLELAAQQDGKKPAEMVTMLISAGLDAREAGKG